MLLEASQIAYVIEQDYIICNLASLSKLLLHLWSNRGPL